MKNIYQIQSLLSVLFSVVFIGFFTANVSASAPKNMVAYFSTAGQSTCPDKWTEAAYAQGRLILGTNSSSDVGTQFGNPMQDSTPPNHSHSYTLTATVPNDSSDNTAPAGSVPKSNGGNLSIPGITATRATSLPFIQFLVCENTQFTAPDTTPYGTIAYFNASTCPAQWSELASANGRFAISASEEQEPGYVSKAVWTPSAPPLHSHTLSSKFSTNLTDFTLFPNPEVSPGAAVPGTYSLAGQTTVTDEDKALTLPYVSLLACQKSAIGHNQDIPLGTTLFYAATNCPDGWAETIGANGRFIVGIPGNGTQGEVFGGSPLIDGKYTFNHDHLFSGQVNLPIWNSGPLGNPHINSGPMVGSASAYNGTSSNATVDLPYAVFQSCTKK